MASQSWSSPSACALHVPPRHCPCESPTAISSGTPRRHTILPSQLSLPFSKALPLIHRQTSWPLVCDPTRMICARLSSQTKEVSCSCSELELHGTICVVWSFPISSSMLSSFSHETTSKTDNSQRVMLMVTHVVLGGQATTCHARSAPGSARASSCEPQPHPHSTHSACPRFAFTSSWTGW